MGYIPWSRKESDVMERLIHARTLRRDGATDTCTHSSGQKPALLKGKSHG